jgi:hypothetical protein
MAVSRLSQSSLLNGFQKFPNVWDGRTAVGGMDPLSTVTLTSAQSSITFNNISQNYTHLQLRVYAGVNSGDTSNWAAQFQFNGDTGSNYNWHLLRGNGSTTQAYAPGSAQTYIYGTEINGYGTNSSLYGWGVGVTDILDYTNTNKYKVTKTITGDESNQVLQTFFGIYSGIWMNTNAINSITIFNGKVFQAGSVFSLYGVK